MGKMTIMMKRIICVLFSILLVMNPLASNVSSAKTKKIDNSYMIIIDASGSMGDTRMQRAKDAAESFLNTLKGKNVEVGLIAFFDCGNVQVLHELTPNIDSLIQPLRGIQAFGGTPLASSIAFGGNYLKENGTGSRGKLIVYTDGEDTCSGDYRETREAIEGLEIDLWGIDLPEEIKKEIETEIGRGSMIDLPTTTIPEIPVKVPEISDIIIEAIPKTLKSGQKFQIVLKAEWSDGSISIINSNEVTYRSSREDRVIINEGGELTALTTGTSFIDVEYAGKKLRQLITVEAEPILIEFYTDTAIPAKMAIGDDYTISGLKAKWSDGSVTDVKVEDVTISSTQINRVAVSDEGKLQANTAGTSYIDVVYKGKKIRTLVNVESGLELTKFYMETAIPAKMVIGDEYTISGLKAKWSDGSVTDVKVKDVTISSTQEDRVIASEEGKIKASAAGTSYIDVVYKGKKIRTLVNVESGLELTKFYIETAIPAKMVIGDEYTISGLKAKWSDGSVTGVKVEDVTISSTQEDRVIASEEGKIKASAAGTSYIDVVYKGKKIRTLVNVESTLKLTKFYTDTAVPAKMVIGDEHTISGLKAKWSDGSVTDVKVEDVTISSSQQIRVAVSSEGKLKANAAGTSYIDIVFQGVKNRFLITISK